MSSARTTEEAGQRSRARRKLVVLLLTTAAIAVGGVLLIGPVREDLVGVVNGFGSWAPALFVLLYVLLSLLLVPTSVLALTAGVLFGALTGAALSVVGGVTSASIGFLIGRRLGRRPVERVAGERLDEVDRWLRRHGLVTIAVARNIPSLPYGLVNYVAGVTGIPGRRFVAGTLLGIVPGSLAYASFGGSLDDFTSPRFWAAASLLVVVVLGGVLLERKLSPPDDR